MCCAAEVANADTAGPGILECGRRWAGDTDRKHETMQWPRDVLEMTYTTPRIFIYRVEAVEACNFLTGGVEVQNMEEDAYRYRYM